MKFFKENGPHIKSEDTTSKIMTRLLIALAPIICFVIFKNSMLVYYYTDATVLEAFHPVLMIITAIITPFVALAIKIDSPGPVFFSQTRIGKNGRRFKIWKFRSMYIDAEERKKELEAQNEVKYPWGIKINGREKGKLIVFKKENIGKNV